jgi:hypothetical protein
MHTHDNPNEHSYEEKLSYEHEKAIYDYYLKERSETNRFALEIGGRYEKFYMFITGGAFISSLTFIESIAPNPIPFAKYFIVIAWLTLALGMILALWAIFTSQNALNRQIEILDIEYAKHINQEDEAIQLKDSKTNSYINKTKVLNFCSLPLTTIGLLFLILFVISNYIN